MIVPCQAGQQNVLPNLRPRIPPRRQPPSPAEGALLGRMRSQGREQAEKFLGVLGLQDQGVVARHGVVLPGAAGARHTAGRHGLEAHQTKGFVRAVRQHRIRALEQHLAAGAIQWRAQTDQVRPLKPFQRLQESSDARLWQGALYDAQPASRGGRQHLIPVGFNSAARDE
jgi:hypothetical protein